MRFSPSEALAGKGSFDYGGANLFPARLSTHEPSYRPSALTHNGRYLGAPRHCRNLFTASNIKTKKMSSEEEKPVIDSKEVGDIFDSILNLEDEFYQEGYELGARDGEKAGRIEGRLFGIRKGFEKMLVMGKLRGQALVWRARHELSRASPTHDDITQNYKQAGLIGSKQHEESEVGSSEFGVLVEKAKQESKLCVRFFLASTRLEKNIDILLEVTEPSAISTQNNEDSIEEFDDKFKRASAKLKVIEATVRETKRRSGIAALEDDQGGSAKSRTHPVRLADDARAAEKNIEDFGLGNR